ncbi:MAG: hypothetical protein KC777_12300 [Cyanobacteria bacterium HKST-UBA02]|nr:hypothetical protein [Cyanobacteria bacterium HKST-UBA02]
MSGLGLRRIAFAAACFLLSTVGCFAQEQAGYSQAMALYKAKRYDQAARLFERAWQADDSNPKAAYFAGYCAYLSGRRPESCRILWQLVDRHGDSPEAGAARKMLSQTDPAGAYRKARGASPVVSKTSVSSSTAQSSETPKQLVDAIVTVHKPTGKFPAVTPTFVASIKDMLMALPESVLRTLRDKRGKVSIRPSVIEMDYRIQNTRPRGWTDGSSWANSPALTQGREVVVSQYRLDDSGNPINTDSEIGVVRHEVGHALDYCLGSVSETEKFKHAYLLDAAKVPGDLRGRLDYYLQKSDAGPSEVFAELFNARFGGYTDRGRAGSSALVDSNFPLCKKIVDECLAKMK